MVKKFTDERGDFILFDTNGCDQVNVVTNTDKYTFRGLHYQTNPAQIKTVKVIQGKVLDILYNIETEKVEFYVLDKYSQPFEIGSEYAHGYLTLEPNTIFTYAVEGDYNPESEHSIIWSSIPSIKAVIMSHVKSHNIITISKKDMSGK
jgi:dTDP-4-dehydrorhamnose 3,5-epimerase-like enzyme